MQILRVLLFLFCIPSFLLQPIPSFSFYESSIDQNQEQDFPVPKDKLGRVNPWTLLQSENLSIDRYFAFIDLVEDKAFLDSLSKEEFDIVVNFVTYMVKAGVPEGVEELKDAYQKEIDQLMEDLYGEPTWNLTYKQNGELSCLPLSLFSKNTEIFLCKSWLKRKASHFGHWCKKNKKPLIAAAVVVGVFTVAALTAGVGSSSAVAVGGALAGAANSQNDSPHINKPGEVFTEDISPSLSPDTSSHGDLAENPTPSFHASSASSSSLEIPEPSPLEQAHTLTAEQTEEAKWEIAEAIYEKEHTSKNPLEQAKDITKTVISSIVHDAFESVAKIGTTWHEMHPNSTPEDQQAYREYVAKQHENIDKIFGTYRPDYSLESQEYSEAFKAAIIEELGHYPEMQMGELPPPGSLINSASKAATIAAKTLDTAAKSRTAIGSIAAISNITNWNSPIPMTQVSDTIGW